MIVGVTSPKSGRAHDHQPSDPTRHRPSEISLESANRQQYYHAPNLLFQSQTSRSAPQNLERALSNLHATIVSAARGLIRGETSPEQRQRVAGLAAAEKARRKDLKMKMKAKKSSRRGEF